MSAFVDRLEGELLRFTFRTDDGGFAVARVRAGPGLEHLVVGPIAHVTEGQHVSLEGRWSDHSQFGRQFKVSRVLVDDPRTLQGLERYLASDAVKGLGPEFARRVVEHFGLDTLRIIEEEPERLVEVSGIGQKRMAEIVNHWERDRQHREIHASLRGYGIGQALANRIVEQYGDRAMGVVARDPYRLAAEVQGVGFRTADRIATENGIPADDPSRAEAALIHCLREAEGQGHCFLPRAELLTRARALDVPEATSLAALERLCLLGGRLGERLISHRTADPERAPIYRPLMERAEAQVALDLLRLVQGPPSTEPPALLALQERLGLVLNLDQERAVRTALQSGVAVITGGPGTGKTTIVRVLLEAARLRSERWLLCAPTGRAAKRLTETTGVEAKTLHRTLEFNGRNGQFTRGRMNPFDAEGVLVDEASMLDVYLAGSLLAAVADGCRLILVGDKDQLPSVGPGRVLADLIASGAVPVVTLTEVYRQAAGSGIVRNAHRVNHGDMPVSGERERSEDGRTPDFYLIGRDDPLEAQATLLSVVGERLPALGFDPRTDVQVLTPMHNGPLGTGTLNERLQHLLNNAGEVFQRGQHKLRVGDRVVQSRNDYDNDVFNGDTGRIVGLAEGGVRVDFADKGEAPREVLLKGESLDDLDLAYAMSIHKSQGSEYPAVVVVLHRSHRIMLRRNLLYTAMTRARRFCCVIGSPWAVEVAVGSRGGEERWTLLRERLAGELR